MDDCIISKFLNIIRRSRSKRRTSLRIWKEDAPMMWHNYSSDGHSSGHTIISKNVHCIQTLARHFANEFEMSPKISPKLYTYPSKTIFHVQPRTKELIDPSKMGV
jgi:hypothetical protein